MLTGSRSGRTKKHDAKIHRLSPILVVLSAVAGPALGVSLPQEHPYQRKLRQYLATLKAEDFALAAKKFTPPTGDLTDARKYREWVAIFPYGWPYLGIIVAPGDAFLLSRIEGDEKVMTPASRAETAAWILNWKVPGNPYLGSAPLKRRVFVSSAIDLIMHDHLHEHGDGSANRSDYLGGTLIWLAYNYLQVRDALPAAARSAYEAGLKKLILRMASWGPRGAMTDMDLFAPVALRYALDVFPQDEEIRRVAVSYSKTLYTDLRFFHPAGYFVDCQCFDVSYNGISLYFAAWAASISDWPFVHEALAKAYRLRAHLSLPEPDGQAFSPTHMSSRTSADAPHDQWNWENRNVAAAMLSDEALCAVNRPTRSWLTRGPGARYGQLSRPIPTSPDAAPKTWKLRPWGERHWTGFGFLSTIIAPKAEAFFTRLERLRAEKSPLLSLPFKRDEKFVHSFADAFVIAKLDDFGVVIHTGRVGEGHREWKRPYGFGGGALSAFWMPDTGSVVLGRRRGIQGRVWDSFDEWREWPTHAVSGITKGGGIFSSCRIRTPAPVIQIAGEHADIRVSGAIPQTNILQGKVLQGRIDYARHFILDKSGLSIETTVKSDGRDELAELYEIIPVFLREKRRQPKLTPTRIQFRTADQWQDASAECSENVTAVRASRFDGHAMITFDKPQRVKLSKADWLDGYGSRATCRNVLIDLLPQKGEPAPRELRIKWHIAPASIGRDLP